MPNFAKIMARMLPLMDLSILLLGLFIVLLTLAKFQQDKAAMEAETEKQAIEHYVQHAAKDGGFCLFPVFVACPGDEGYTKGKMYRLSNNFQRGDEITGDEIRREIQSNGPNRSIVCLVTSYGADDSQMQKMMDDLKGGLNFDVVHIPNVKFKD